MNATFKASVFRSKEVTPEMICDEVEMIGFDCELLGINEINYGPDQLEDVNNVRMRMRSEDSQSFASVGS